MSETSNTSEPVEVITLDEARELLHAVELLKTIADRSTSAAWETPSNYTPERRVRAQDLGRLAGICTVASDAVFHAISTAATYAAQTGANQALDARRADRAGDEVTS